MIVDRLHELVSRVASHTDEVAEHQAVVDLLVLTVLSDHRVEQDELDALEKFDASHAKWDEGAFSVEQYLPTAMSKVRAALDGGGVDHLISEAAERITTRSLRVEAIAACNEMAQLDGVDQEELQVLSEIEKALS